MDGEVELIGGWCDVGVSVVHAQVNVTIWRCVCEIFVFGHVCGLEDGSSDSCGG